MFDHFQGQCKDFDFQADRRLVTKIFSASENSLHSHEFGEKMTPYISSQYGNHNISKYTENNKTIKYCI